MNGLKLVTPEEEVGIRTELRRELEDKLNQQEQQRLETHRQRAQEERDKEVASIRHDEEVRFYTEQGYVSSARALDDTLDWYKPHEVETKKKKRRRRSSKNKKHRNKNNSFRKYLGNILFVIIAVAGIIMLVLLAK